MLAMYILLEKRMIIKGGSNNVKLPNQHEILKYSF